MSPRPSSTSLTTPPEDQTPDPSMATTQSEGVTVLMPGFQTPPPPAGLDPTPEGTRVSDGPAGPSDEQRDEPLAEPPPATGPSPASTADPDLFVGICYTVVQLASMVVRWARSRMVGGLAEGLWLADEQDVGAIGDPLARIAARHVPVGDAAAAGDVADGIELAVGVVGYGTKNLMAEAEYSTPAAPAHDAGE